MLKKTLISDVAVIDQAQIKQCNVIIKEAKTESLKGQDRVETVKFADSGPRL